MANVEQGRARFHFLTLRMKTEWSPIERWERQVDIIEWRRLTHGFDIVDRAPSFFRLSDLEGPPRAASSNVHDKAGREGRAMQYETN